MKFCKINNHRRIRDEDFLGEKINPMKRENKTTVSVEMGVLQTRLNQAEQRLQEADETLQSEITERKRAEETFRQAQKHFERIVETIREPLLVLSADLKVISANGSFYRTFQVMPKETEGQYVYSIGNHQWDIPALRRLLEEIVPRNTRFNDFEVNHEFPAIGPKTMLLNARRINREGQGTEMILLAIEDVTERRQVEEALEVSEVRFRRLFETAQDGILILDAGTGRIFDVNPFLIEMLGYSHDHFVGKKLWEIGAFKDIQASQTAFSELQTRGYVRYEDLPLRTKDGRLIGVEFVSNVYLVDQQRVIQCNIRDITERKKAEEKQRAREERYRSYVEVTGQLAWTTNSDGEVVEDIPVWRKFTGQNEEETKGSGWAKALHPDDVKDTVEVWNKAVATKSAYEVEYRIRRYDGAYRLFLARGVPVFKDDGNIQEWVGTCIDITERKLIEDVQKFLAQGGLPASGEDFFNSLARYLAEKLGMDYVCIDRLQEKGLAARTVAIYFDGKFEDNLTYTLKDTPCGDVVEKTICCFPKGVRHLYPQDVVLQEMKAESYIGTILWSSKGQPIGLIAIIGRQPLANPSLAESMLKEVAIRAAGELERREAEEALTQRSFELQQLTATLEQRVLERTTDLEKANESLQHLSSRLLSAQEDERRRIAREIHDVLGSSLSAIKFKMEDIIQRIHDIPMGKVIEGLKNLIPVVKGTIDDVRRIQADLRPPLLDDLGIVATLSWYCRRFEAVYSDIKVEQTVTIREEEVPNHLKITLFRITQEALNNIGKHAKADSVYLGLQKVDNTLELCIRDNGDGFDPLSLFSGENPEKGLGLSSMNERTKFSGGSFSFDSAKGSGTVLRAVWPV
jgi:PAS domain S-box-containing protein